MRARLILILTVAVGISLLCTSCCDDAGDNPAAPLTGTITINPDPDSISAPWQIAGPGGFGQSGSGDLTLTDLNAGDYTLTWGAVTGWGVPDPAAVTQTLPAGGTVAFTALYAVQALTITIDPEPDVVNAPWELAGPGGFSQTGNGNLTLADMTAGEYTLTWGAVAGWTAPDPAVVVQTLPADGTLTFTGVYQVRLGFEYIPPGTFLMGSPADEPERGGDEAAHEVMLTRGFWMSKHEVTEELWYAVMGGGSTPSQLPKANITWDQAISFCNALSDQQGLTRAYTESDDGWAWNQAASGYRLPTEAEWECACRAGSPAAFANGSLTSIGCDPLDPSLGAMGWYCGNSAVNTVQVRHAVGQKQANGWGLHDMHGNVCEWCWDWYGSYPAGPVTDPIGPETGYYRVIRGGDFSSTAQACRSAHRYPYYLQWPILSIGLRVVRTAD